MHYDLHYDLPYPARAAHADYSQWSIEELWQLASQLRVAGARVRVAGARGKSRRELIDMFAAAPKEARR